MDSCGTCKERPSQSETSYQSEPAQQILPNHTSTSGEGGDYCGIISEIGSPIAVDCADLLPSPASLISADDEKHLQQHQQKSHSPPMNASIGLSDDVSNNNASRNEPVKALTTKLVPAPAPAVPAWKRPVVTNPLNLMQSLSLQDDLNDTANAVSSNLVNNDDSSANTSPRSSANSSPKYFAAGGGNNGGVSRRKWVALEKVMPEAAIVTFSTATTSPTGGAQDADNGEQEQADYSLSAPSHYNDSNITINAVSNAIGVDANNADASLTSPLSLAGPVVPQYGNHQYNNNSYRRYHGNNNNQYHYNNNRRTYNNNGGGAGSANQQRPFYNGIGSSYHNRPRSTDNLTSSTSMHSNTRMSSSSDNESKTDQTSNQTTSPVNRSPAIQQRRPLTRLPASAYAPQLPGQLRAAGPAPPPSSASSSINTQNQASAAPLTIGQSSAIANSMPYHNNRRPPFYPPGNITGSGSMDFYPPTDPTFFYQQQQHQQQQFYFQQQEEALKNTLKAQIEYYFSLENLLRDVYLRANMRPEGGWIDLAFIAGFNRVRHASSLLYQVVKSGQQPAHILQPPSITDELLGMIARCLQDSSVIELSSQSSSSNDDDQTQSVASLLVRKRGDWAQWVFAEDVRQGILAQFAQRAASVNPNVNNNNNLNATIASSSTTTTQEPAENIAVSH